MSVRINPEAAKPSDQRELKSAKKKRIFHPKSNKEWEKKIDGISE